MTNFACPNIGFGGCLALIVTGNISLRDMVSLPCATLELDFLSRSLRPSLFRDFVRGTFFDTGQRANESLFVTERSPFKYVTKSP